MTGRWMIPVVLAIPLIVTNAVAQTVWMKMVGSDGSCGKWSSMGSNASRSRDATAVWAAGFISGYNYFNDSNQVRRELDKETIVAYIDKHCRDNPLSAIPRAVMELICETHEGEQRAFEFCAAKK